MHALKRKQMGSRVFLKEAGRRTTKTTPPDTGRFAVVIAMRFLEKIYPINRRRAQSASQIEERDRGRATCSSSTIRATLSPIDE